MGGDGGAEYKAFRVAKRRGMQKYPARSRWISHLRVGYFVRYCVAPLVFDPSGAAAQPKLAPMPPCPPLPSGEGRTASYPPGPPPSEAMHYPHLVSGGEKKLPREGGAPSPRRNSACLR